MSQPSVSGTAAPTPAASVRGDAATATAASAGAGATAGGLVVPEGKVGWVRRVRLLQPHAHVVEVASLPVFSKIIRVPCLLDGGAKPIDVVLVDCVVLSICFAVCQLQRA